MPNLAANKKTQLISPIGLIAALIVIMAILFAALPRNSFITNTDKIGKPDTVSAAYLHALLKADPDNISLHIRYVEHLIGLGKYAEAKLRLNKLPEDAAEGKVAYLQFQLVMVDLMQAPQEIGLQKAVAQRIELLLALPVAMVSFKTWESIASRLIQAGQVAKAAKIYVHLSNIDAAHQLVWLQEAALHYLSADQAVKAAGIRVELATLTGEMQDAQMAVNAMLLAGESERALALMHAYLTRFSTTHHFLHFALLKAQQLGKITEAESWLESWLLKHPSDSEMRQQAIDFQLALGEVKKAWVHSKKLVASKPDVASFRQQLAKVSLWASQHDEAIQQLLWLSLHQPKQDEIRQAIGLVLAFHDFETARLLNQRLAAHYPLSPEDLLKQAVLQEKVGLPKQSEQTVVRYLQHSPTDAAQWRVLARLREYNGNVQGALEAWQKIGQRFGLSEQVLMQQAKMLAKQSHMLEALQLMHEFTQKHTATSLEFWQIYGDLAWILERDAEAFVAYRWLWDHQLSEALEAQRLIILLRNHGEVHDVFRISSEAWHKLHHPEVLLLAIESAIQMQRWQEVEKFIGIAETEADTFYKMPRYWLMYANWSAYQRKWQVALHSYQRVLNLESGNIDARTARLWLHIQMKNKAWLKRDLAQWYHDAVHHYQYWEVYAAGYTQLGMSEKALAWFQKVLREKPHDVIWTLQYADALTAAGRASAAWRLRRYFFKIVWPKYQQNHTSLNAARIERVRQVGLLKHRMYGARHTHIWVTEMMRKYQNDPLFPVFSVLWSFDMSRLAYANFWLLRQHAKRMATPLWQQLALAMQHNDLEKIDGILAQSSPLDIDDSARVLAYRQLQFLDQAWLLAMNIDVGSGVRAQLQRTGMLRHARNISALTPNASHVAWQYDNLQRLSLSKLKLSHFQSGHNRRYSLKSEWVSLQSSDLHSNQKEQEIQWRFEREKDSRRGAWSFYLGQNQRASTLFQMPSLWQWGTDWHYQAWQGGSFGVGLSRHEVATETPLARLLVQKDTAYMAISHDFTSREFVSSQLYFNRYRYRTVSQSPAAQGYTWHMLLGHRLGLANSLAEEQMQVRITTALSSNRSQAEVPLDIQRAIPNVTRESIIPNYSASLGVGLNLQRDQPMNDAAVARSFSYMFDMWLGWQWPSSQMAYNLTMSAALPVIGHDALSANFYMGNTLTNALSTQASYGLEIKYGYRF